MNHTRILLVQSAAILDSLHDHNVLSQVAQSYITPESLEQAVLSRLSSRQLYYRPAVGLTAL